MGFEHKYGPVKGDEDAKDDVQPTIIAPPPSTTPWWILLLSHLLAIAVGAGAMGLYFQTHYVAPSNNTTTPTNSSTGIAIPSPPPTELLKGTVDNPSSFVGQILDCGYSPQEARDKGCVYDVMMQDWVRPECFDKALTEQYLAKGNWTWYADGEGKTTLSNEEMAKGEHGAAWMATSYHKAHCVFSWQKIIRALRNNKGISQELLSYDHVLHCAHGALRADSDDEGLGVRAPTNYAKCALYDTWITDLIPDQHNSSMRL